MNGFPSGVRVHLEVQHHDMRKSFNGLATRGVGSGAMFAFTNKRRNRLKILYYYRTVEPTFTSKPVGRSLTQFIGFDLDDSIS